MAVPTWGYRSWARFRRATAISFQTRRRARLRPTPVSDRLGDPADAFRLALAHVPHGLCMFDADKRLILCNKAYAEMYRLPSSLAERGTPLDAILDHRRAVGNAPADPDTYFDVVMMAHRSGRHEGARVRLVDGRTIQITHNPMPDCGYVAVHEDVTAYVDVEDRLRYLAGHDQLTGLRNRHAFAETFAATLATARPGVDIALHYLDLDRFKAVNDAFGHDLGDMLLQKVAKRLTMCASHRDVVGRIGGDEFVILQPMVDGKLGATDMASRVIEAVAQPYRLTGHQVSVGCEHRHHAAPGSWIDAGPSSEECGSRPL